MKAMKRCALFLLVLVIAITGCAGPAPTSMVTPPTVTPGVTHTRTPAPAATQTASRTPTPYATRTQVPSPTLTFTPSITPTYDPRTARTITSVPAAVCPAVNPSYQPVFTDLDIVGDFALVDLSGPLLEALNQGAGLPALKRAVSSASYEGQPAEIPAEAIYAKDITGDGVPEIIFDEDWLIIYTCENGRFREVLKWNSGGDYYIEKPVIADLNLDGLVEVIVETKYYVMNVRDHYFNILRWNGTDFADLMADQDLAISGLIEWSARDVDGNGTLELVVRNWPSTSHDSELHGPWRHETYTLVWNGSAFVLQSMMVDPPEYRFQAVQDGDRAMRRGDYRDAIRFFQQAIEDAKLKGWGYSIEHHWQRSQAQSDRIMQTPTPTMLPLDPEEPLNLKAYAHYRLMLAYTAVNEAELAKTEYAALQREYPAGKTGSVYAELATTFLEAYKKEGSLNGGCQRVVEYTRANEDAVLGPLNHYMMGFQNISYAAEDLCLSRP